MTPPVAPYGVAIHEAIQSGDTARMQQVARDAQQWVQEVQAALEKLHKHLGSQS